ncbi:hypothetical protein [Aquabacterium sp. A08]|uniref:hypothetical protein n=1 Tax=Aquabacterium sp. A08 TaxID=2718532 RepID=UPI001423CE56|nr:hypothetical protein [Aquabacterium sp. A08]NIC40747.1 hypothetical protein [Aquabacterium sp. A08]
MHDDFRPDNRPQEFSFTKPKPQGLTGWHIAFGVAGGILLAVFALVAFIAWGQHQAEQEARAYLQQVQRQQQAQKAALQREQEQRREQAELERQKRIRAAASAQRFEQEVLRVEQDEAQRKADAWAKFYKRPDHCDQATGAALVECGNHHIRAKRRFEALYTDGQL